MDQGDTITAKNLIREAANKGCSLAEIFSMVPDGKDLVRADAAKLAMIAEQVPLIYSLLGNLYYEPDENGKTEEQLAVEYYMKAEEHAMLVRMVLMFACFIMMMSESMVLTSMLLPLKGCVSCVFTPLKKTCLPFMNT